MFSNKVNYKENREKRGKATLTCTLHHQKVLITHVVIFCYCNFHTFRTCLTITFTRIINTRAQFIKFTRLTWWKFIVKYVVLSNFNRAEARMKIVYTFTACTLHFCGRRELRLLSNTFASSQNNPIRGIEVV